MLDNQMNEPIENLESTAPLSHDPLAANAGEGTPKAGTVARQRTIKKVAPAILLVCLVLAILTVLLVPMLVGGAVPATSRVTSSSSAPAEEKSFSSTADAQQMLGYQVALPSYIPEGYNCAAVRVLEGNILELQYTAGKDTFFYRMAAGTEDLTEDATEYAYSTTASGEITRVYAGVSEKKLNTAVWTNDNFAFAVVAPSGIPAAELKQIAESVN